MSLGERIETKRKLLHLSQQAVAKELGVDKSTLSRLESDEIKRPSREMLRKLSKILQEPIRYFYAEEDEATPSEHVKIVVGVKDAGEEILGKFYSKGKEVILKSSSGSAEIKGKVIECTKSFEEEK